MIFNQQVEAAYEASFLSNSKTSSTKNTLLLKSQGSIFDKAQQIKTTTNPVFGLSKVSKQTLEQRRYQAEIC